MDNANTITDMAKVKSALQRCVMVLQCWRNPLIFQTQNNVYEILSDVNSRQEIMDERIHYLEDRIAAIQDSMDRLPDALSR